MEAFVFDVDIAGYVLRNVTLVGAGAGKLGENAALSFGDCDDNRLLHAIAFTRPLLHYARRIACRHEAGIVGSDGSIAYVRGAYSISECRVLTYDRQIGDYTYKS